MRSDIVKIENSGEGFQNAIEEAQKVAAYKKLDETQSVQLQILTQEMLGLASSITGEMNASFWIELENKLAVLHMTTSAVLDKAKRAELLESSTSRKNEAAHSFIGVIRDHFEAAMLADPEIDTIPEDVMADLPSGLIEATEWDGYERSILKNLADDIRIGIKGGIVEITVSKKFNTQQ